MGKKINKKKLDKLYSTTIQDSLDKGIKEKNLVFEQKIYYDKRQYSVKLPKRLFDFIDFKEGDALCFTLDYIDPDKPKIKINYKQSK